MYAYELFGLISPVCSKEVCGCHSYFPHFPAFLATGGCSIWLARHICLCSFVVRGVSNPILWFSRFSFPNPLCCHVLYRQFDSSYSRSFCSVFTSISCSLLVFRGLFLFRIFLSENVLTQSVHLFLDSEFVCCVRFGSEMFNEI